MFAPRAAANQIDRYSGPYERWTYSPELGLPFAFPAIRNGDNQHFSALMEGPGMLAGTPGFTVRVPPLWSSDADVTPFAFFQTDPDAFPGDSQDVKLSKILDEIGGARFRVNMPIHRDTWPKTYDPDADVDGWSPPAVKPSVIIGVIDDGIPFMNRAFVGQSDKSRMSLCWLQAARANEAASVPFGREITGDQIDALRAKHGPHEMRAYRDAGAIDTGLPELGNVLAHHATHGGHISGIAAGNDAIFGGERLPDDAQIIAVQLPNTVAWDTSGFGKEMMMLSALEYIFERARMVAEAFDGQEIPLVVNFSYGWSANRHDGKSSFERAVEHLLSKRKAIQPKTELVMPTGNNFSNRMHAHFGADDVKDGVVEFGWQLQPDDRTSSYLEIWLPEGFKPTDWNVTVTPPSGTLLTEGGALPIAPDPNLAGGDPRRFDELEINGENIGQLSVDYHMGDRWRIMLAMAPTAAYRGRTQRTPVGLWTVAVETGNTPLPLGKSIEVWVQRDDDPTQLGTGGQQSHLVDLAHPAPPRPFERDALMPVRGYGCLNGIGTAPSVLRVAGYVQTTLKPSYYSGGGSIRRGLDGKFAMGQAFPRLCAVADQGQFRPGLPSIGVLSGSSARIVGTSAAAAAATRTIACNMANDRPSLDGAADLHQNINVAQITAMDVAQDVSRLGLQRLRPLEETSHFTRRAPPVPMA